MQKTQSKCISPGIVLVNKEASNSDDGTNKTEKSSPKFKLKKNPR